MLVIIGLAQFIAIGLNPILEFFIDGGLRRGFIVIIVTLGFVLIVVCAATVSTISHEVQSLVKNYPRYKANLAAERGWGGEPVAILQLTSYLKASRS